MQAKRYQVFISSTFTDLKDERQKVLQAIMEMDCMPAGMELFPAMDQEQFDFIKTVIDDSDYYVIIVGGRYGSENAAGISYTEAEYDYAVSIGLKVIALIHGNPGSLPVDKAEIGEAGRAKLENFRTKLMSGRLVRHWQDSQELPGLIALSLQKTIKTYPAVGWIRGDSTVSPEILTQINELKLQNQKLIGETVRLRSKIYQPSGDLASGTDTIKLNFTYHSRLGANRGPYPSSIEITWNNIIDLFGLKLMQEITSGAAQSIFENAMAEMNKWKECDIRDYDMETIGIQLSSLGLLRIRHAKSTTGSTYIWWQWTDRGLEYVKRNRAIKRKAQAHDTDSGDVVVIGPISDSSNSEDVSL